MRYCRKFEINRLNILSIVLSLLLVDMLHTSAVVFAVEQHPRINAFITAYPDHITEAGENHLVWKDGANMIFDDGNVEKSFEELLDNADLEDQLFPSYPEGKSINTSPAENFDPGRFRYEPFFRKMYGNTKEEAEKNLVTIKWMPSTVNRVIRFTKVNDAHLKLQAVSKELDKLPNELKKYVTDIAGTFNWRKIAGTNRVSTHSFGIAIDINVKLSNYWYWTKPDSKGKYKYKNNIPLEIVKTFEKHGFIWGGRWYHYDTMHFEYRPELIINTVEQDK